MSSKDAPQKMQFFGTRKIWQVCSRGYKTQSGGKPPQIRQSSNQNMSKSQCSCIFQEPLNRDKYAYKGLFVKYGLGESSYVSKIPQVEAKNQTITVCVFLSFAANRFTFKQIPHPPPCLHHSEYCAQW